MYVCVVMTDEIWSEREHPLRMVHVHGINKLWLPLALHTMKLEYESDRGGAVSYNLYSLCSLDVRCTHWLDSDNGCVSCG